MRKRFWFEIVVGGLGLVLLVVTLISKEWIGSCSVSIPTTGAGHSR